jgi:hypothetical protein
MFGRVGPRNLLRLSIRLQVTPMLAGIDADRDLPELPKCVCRLTTRN